MAPKDVVLALLVIIAFRSVQSFAIYGDGPRSPVFTAAIAESMIEKLENRADVENNKFAEYFLTAMSAVFPAADKALLQFKSSIDDAIQNATNKLQAMTDDLAKQADTTVNQSNIALHQESMSLLYEVGMLEESCRSLGIDPGTCTKGKDKTIQKLPHQYSDKLQECQGDKVKQGKSLIKNAVKKVKDSLDEVERFSDDLKLCDKQKGVRVKLCKAKISTSIVKATEGLPIEINRIVTDTMQFISSVYSEVQICTVTVNTEFLNQGKAIIDDIEKCIDAQIQF